MFTDVYTNDKNQAKQSLAHLQYLFLCLHSTFFIYKMQQYHCIVHCIVVGPLVHDHLNLSAFSLFWSYDEGVKYAPLAEIEKNKKQ